MQFSQYPDLDLPIFDADEHLYRKPRMARIQEATTDNVLRHTVTRGHDDMSAMERIRTAEEEFTRIEELCGARVVPHQYGLYPTKDRPELHAYEDSRILPRGFLLAARVAVIQDIAFKADPLSTAMLNRHERKLIKPVLRGITRYRNKGGLLIDIKGEQFTYGRLQGRSEHEWILHDIEPRIRNNNDPHSRKYTRS